MTFDTEKVKKLLLKEKASVEKRILDLRASDPFRDSEYTDDNAAVDTDVREQESHQRIQAEIDTLKHRITDIQIALQRVESGSYGVCKRCNSQIPEKRLQIIPESIYCVSCESSLTR